MPDSSESLIVHILQRGDLVSIYFYKNGMEGEGYFELNNLLGSVMELFELMMQDGTFNEELQRLQAILSLLNSSIEKDDVVKICDLINFELRPLLSAIGGGQ